MEEVLFKRRGEAKKGAQNFVRQAQLDKKPEPEQESMVRLAGVGHEVPDPASTLNYNKNLQVKAK